MHSLVVARYPVNLRSIPGKNTVIVPSGMTLDTNVG